MKRVYKRHRDYGFFDQDIRLNKLTQLGDPLEKLNRGIDFETFRDFLEEKLTPTASGSGGRPPYDYVLLFKILILQRYYNLSDEQTEFQINDRMSFMRFLNLTIADDIPDSRTIWVFREKLTNLDLVESLFNLFLRALSTLKLIVHEGKIVDASFVEVPRQRNTREQNKQLKAGELPAEFTGNPHVLSQKDTEARWTKKNNQTFYGYKNHVKIDAHKKFIHSYVVTTASVHDSQPLDNLINIQDKGQPLHADSAYTGPNQEAILEKNKMVNQVHEKGSKNKPLTKEQKASNTEKSRVRARVEHIFGFMENSMNKMYLHYIGIRRARAAIGMMNLVYNMNRKLQVMAA